MAYGRNSNALSVLDAGNKLGDLFSKVGAQITGYKNQQKADNIMAEFSDPNKVFLNEDGSLKHPLQIQTAVSVAQNKLLGIGKPNEAGALGNFVNNSMNLLQQEQTTKLDKNAISIQNPDMISAFTGVDFNYAKINAGNFGSKSKNYKSDPLTVNNWVDPATGKEVPGYSTIMITSDGEGNLKQQRIGGGDKQFPDPKISSPRGGFGGTSPGEDLIQITFKDGRPPVWGTQNSKFAGKITVDGKPFDFNDPNIKDIIKGGTMGYTEDATKKQNTTQYAQYQENFNRGMSNLWDAYNEKEDEGMKFAIKDVQTKINNGFFKDYASVEQFYQNDPNLYLAIRDNVFGGDSEAMNNYLLNTSQEILKSWF